MWAYMTRALGRLQAGQRVWVETDGGETCLACIDGTRTLVPRSYLRMGGHRQRKTVKYLLSNPWATAVQIARHFKESSSTTSSFLLGLVKEGVLERKKGCGPRGGYGYRVKRPVPTAFSRLGRDDFGGFLREDDGVG